MLDLDWYEVEVTSMQDGCFCDGLVNPCGGGSGIRVGPRLLHPRPAVVCVGEVADESSDTPGVLTGVTAGENFKTADGMKSETTGFE
jgi:hypothetical protein